MSSSTADIVAKSREYFLTGKTLPVNERIKQLKILQQAIIKEEQAIFDALKLDLNKAPFEAYATEVGIVLEEISYMLKNIKRLARPKAVRTPLTHAISKSKIYKEPYGVALIMSPWNYPFQLSIAPLVGAIATGNCALIKPSNYSANTSQIIKKIISENFDPSYISVILGGRDVNLDLLEQKFDYIMFTGSVSVGKIVMEKAAKHLTPVSLELGGKSPCIVDASANVDLAAKRIAWGKFINAGQTCVAPDYILVHSSVKKQLISSLNKYITQFFGSSPESNDEYPKIISRKHFDRINGLIENEEVVCGGKSNEKTMQIAPTVLNNVKLDAPVMQEEIFGPILPLIEFSDINEVVKIVESRAKPLALYLFTTSSDIEKLILNKLSFGGGCVNDVVVHLATSYMPFGGVGESGMGGYHGEFSFDTFSHKKSILKKSNIIDINVRYAPYKNKLKILKWILK